jgi:hypothetical protein
MSDIKEKLEDVLDEVKKDMREIKPKKKQAKYFVWIVLILVALVLLVAIGKKVFGASFASGTASTAHETRNVVLTGFCLYGDGTNAATVYFMDDTTGDGTGDRRVSDTIQISAGSYGPVCITYAAEGGISCTGLVSVLGGTGGQYGVTYDRR